MRGKLVLLIGPSGVGKSAILKALKAMHPEYVFPRSATTRQRRTREGDELYHFITEDQFSKWIDEGKFLEWAQVHKGARYGTLRSEIIPAIETGRTVIREVDVQGFESIRNHPDFSGELAPYKLHAVFILPESKDQLIARILKRSPMTDDELSRRIDSMEKELQAAKLCDAKIVNVEGNLQETIKQVEAAIA